MSASRRTAAAIALTLLLVGAGITPLILRTRSALARGTLGLNYLEKASPKQPKVFGLSPGQVMVVLPDGTAAAAGMRRGDEIVAINGHLITDSKALKKLDEAAKVGSVLTYRLKRDGKTFDVRVPVGHAFSNPITVIYLALIMLVAACFIATGLIVFTRKPDDRRVKVFFAMMLGGAAALMGNGSMQVDNNSLRGIYVDPISGLIPVVILGIASMAFAPLALHMSLIFPHDRPILRRYPRILRLVYAIPVIAVFTIGLFMLTVIMTRSTPRFLRGIDIGIDVFLGVLGAGGLLLLLQVVREARTNGFRDAVLRRPLQSLGGVFGILAGMLAIAGALKIKWLALAVGIAQACLPFALLFSLPILTCINFYRSYRDAGVEERRQVQWPLWGVLIAFGIKIAFAIIVQAGSFVAMFAGYDMSHWINITTVLQMIPVVAYLLIPISFAFAILKYRLMNIDVIIKKTVAYAILSGAVILLYLVLVGGLGTLLIRMAGVKNATTVMAATLVVAIVFVPLRNKLQHLVDRNLFRQKYDYPQALRAISTDTVGAVSLPPYLSSITDKIQQPLQNRAVVLYLRRENDLIATAKVGVADSVIGTRISSATADSIDRPLDPRRRTLAEQDSTELRRLNICLLVPVRSHGIVAALIALAPKLSDQEFDLEDIEFVSSAASARSS